MSTRSQIRVGTSEESLRRASEQRIESLRAHLDANDVVQLYLNFCNWMQARRTSARLFHVRWQQDDAAMELTSMPVNRVAELMSHFRRGDFDALESLPWTMAPEPVKPPSLVEPEPEVAVGEGDEFLYVLVNDSMPGFIKIGRTENDPDDRARQLSSFTGVPTAFRVYRSYAVADSV